MKVLGFFLCTRARAKPTVSRHRVVLVRAGNDDGYGTTIPPELRGIPCEPLVWPCVS